jgi:hypothetical protein
VRPAPAFKRSAVTLPTTFSVRIDRKSLGVECAGSVFVVGDLIVACAGFVSPGGSALTGREAAAAIAAAYQVHGSRLTAHLLGQFCAVIADSARRSIMLVQDSLGLRTVYFHLDRERLAAASELANAVRLSANADVCEEFFARYLQSGRAPSELTPFAGVRRLCGGTTLALSSGREEAFTPWRPPETAADRQIDAGEAVEMLDGLLSAALTASMPASGRTSCQLSGGMDSSTVALYAKANGSDVEALTFVSGSGRAGDDEGYAQAVAQHLDLKWTCIDHDEYPPLSRHESNPWVMPGGELFLALRKAYQSFLREREISVVLTGSAGDQVFGSTDIIPIHIADDLQRLRFRRAWQEARNWKHTLASTRSESFLLWNYGFQTLRLRWKGESISGWRAPRVPGWLLPQFLTRNGAVAHDLPLSLGLEQPGSQYFWELIFQLAQLESSTANLGYPAEIRHPLFYRPLSEFMSAIGPGWRRGRGGDRVLHRKLLFGKLPQEIVTRRTKASNQPLWEEALQQSRGWFDILTRNCGLIERGWVDERLWIDACKKARVGFSEDPEQFNAAMCTEYWLRALGGSSCLSTPPLHAPNA